MLSKNKIKYIRSLQTKKGRESEKCYIAEGERIFNELIHSNCKIVEIIALPEWLELHSYLTKTIPVETASQEELQAISTLSTAQNVLCIVKIEEPTINISSISDQLIIGLDTIQDPGNMGTIIRLANWFGIDTIICSTHCVDVFNPKVVQASMGAICRINIYYTDLQILLHEYKTISDNPIYGTFLDGDNIYTSKLSKSGIIIFGNEGNGISREIENCITQKITIPSFNNQGVVESLNVSIAASIVCSEFRRQI